MGRRKRKLTPKEKAAKKRRQELYEWVMIRGKQVRVRRAPQVEGMDVEEFIRLNADPIWLHQEGLWELMEPEPPECGDADPEVPF